MHFVKQKIWFVIFAVSISGFSFAEVSSNNKDAQKGSSVSKEESTGKKSIPDTEVIGGAGSYTLGKGDIIQIIVRNQPEFSGKFEIGHNGYIQYAFIGDIKAEGFTKEQFKEAVAKELEKYVKVPEVDVTIAEYRSKFFYILGEVARPGKYPMEGDSIDLRETLIVAGLPTPDAALRRVYVIKPDNAKPVYRKVDIYKLLYKGRLKDNLLLGNGDLVVVSSTVPSEINRALTNLLSPITRAAIVEDLINRNR